MCISALKISENLVPWDYGTAREMLANDQSSLQHSQGLVYAKHSELNLSMGQTQNEQSLK